MLTKADIREFRKGGFTDLEIERIQRNLEQKPQEINPANEAWQKTFKERLDYIRLQLVLHKTLREIYAKLDSYYSVSNISTPWDFLREAYPLKGGKKADFNTRIETGAKARDRSKERASARIKKHYGGQY